MNTTFTFDRAITEIRGQYKGLHFLVFKACDEHGWPVFFGQTVNVRLASDLITSSAPTCGMALKNLMTSIDNHQKTNN